MTPSQLTAAWRVFQATDRYARTIERLKQSARDTHDDAFVIFAAGAEAVEAENERLRSICRAIATAVGLRGYASRLDMIKLAESAALADSDPADTKEKT